MVDIFGIPFNLVIPDGGAGGEVQQVEKTNKQNLVLNLVLRAKNALRATYNSCTRGKCFVSGDEDLRAAVVSICLYFFTSGSRLSGALGTC